MGGHRRSSRAERVEAMRAVWEATVKEADDGWMGSGITLQELLSTYGNVSGKHPQNGPVGTLNARVMMRHGVYQGYKQKKAKGKGKKSKSKPVFDEEGKPIMVRKLRCIDDAKASRSNSCEYTYETIATCSFDYVAHVAEAVAAECAAKALPMPEMVFSTDDMRAAYRQIPCSQPGHTMVCVYKFGKDEGPRFFPVHGFNFGHVSSVVRGRDLAGKTSVHPRALLPWGGPRSHATTADTLGQGRIHPAGRRCTAPAH